MSNLPRNLSGFDVVKALSKAGFVLKRQKGSHAFLEKIDGRVRWGCVVPMHNELKIGTLKGILRQARMSEEEFLDLL